MRNEAKPKRNMTWHCLAETLQTHLPLLGILLGSVLVSFSLGPFSNWDAQLEYGAASSVLQYGFPYTPNGGLINQPPVGYFVDGLFFRVFGLSYSIGVAVVTLFGVGCVLLVYGVGREFYGEQAGLVAAGLFALSPWQVLLSRSFLIDVQCLFFSLLFLLVGVWAIRRNSTKLFFVSGALFGVAYLTKAFAVFMLIPLVLIFLLSWRRISKPAFSAATFVLPALFLNFLWYQVVSGQGFFALLRHDDFTNYMPAGMAPSPFFVGDFLLSSAGVGVFVLIAALFSLAVGVSLRKQFEKLPVYDVVLGVAVACVLGLVMFLGLGLGLASPYMGLVKYLFPLLPMFCWLAASLPVKLKVLAVSEGSGGKRRKAISIAALVGVAFLVTALVLDVVAVFSFSRQSYVEFESGGVVYSLVNSSLLAWFGPLAFVQGLGFGAVLISVLYVVGKNLKMTLRS